MSGEMDEPEKMQKEQLSECVLPTDSCPPARPPAHVVLWDEAPEDDQQEGLGDQ